MEQKYDIEIPRRLKNKLPDGSFVFSMLRNIEPLLKAINYFPEYTLHDSKHLENVLKISSDLIPEKTFKKLSKNSIEYLVAAILLHDLGMFISRDGLNNLIWGAQEYKCSTDLCAETWKELWQNYYSKAKKYNDKKLIEIFGDNQPVDQDIDNNVPEENTERQRLLFGDFLRQYHHRLAYETAKQGFPGNEVIDVFQDSTITETDREIIGIIAYSHGVDLRSTEQYIKHYQIDLTKICPIYYLMSVLRIADYLDILDKRAPENIRRKQRFHSPISQREYDLNQSVIDLSFVKEQKSYFVNAEPECSTIFIYTQNTLKGIQNELDRCWAFLAEKYNYDYELSIHRITSNLLDDKKIKSFNNLFLTKKAELTVNHDLIKVFAEPLYGHNPTFAVRELMQNSIDACNERYLIDNIAGNIEINIDTEHKEFVITDNGIGMSEDVLINYYLTTGSSYRNSDSWKDTYINDNGSAKFCRIGKFGVGVLATFLIGDEIEVATRHLNDEKGYYFTLNINTASALDVKRIDHAIGSTIKIHMNETAVNYFKRKWNQDEWLYWYHFKEPNIVIMLDGVLLNRKNIIDLNNLNCRWHKIENTCFDELLWSYEPQDLRENDWGKKYYESYYYDVILNGFQIQRFLKPFEANDAYNNWWSVGSQYGFAIHLPTISVRDTAYEFIKTDLSRNVVTYMKLEPELMREIYKYFIAHTLCHKLDLIVDGYYWLRFYRGKMPLAISDKGYTILSRSFILNTKKDVICFLGSFKKFEEFDVGEHNLKSHLINSGGYRGDPDTLYCSSSLYHDIYVNGERLMENSRFMPCCTYVLMYLKESYIEKNDYMKLSDYLDDQTINKYYRIYFSETEKAALYKSEIRKYYAYLKNEVDSCDEESRTTRDDRMYIIRYSPIELSEVHDQNIMLDLLHKYLPVTKNDGLIPFDIEERRSLYADAFEALAEYIPTEDNMQPDQF